MPTKLDIRDFPERRILAINGINYAYELFESFGEGGLPVGAILQILARKDGVIVVRRLEELESLIQAEAEKAISSDDLVSRIIDVFLAETRYRGWDIDEGRFESIKNSLLRILNKAGAGKQTIQTNNNV